jgi:hypothetical protein
MPIESEDTDPYEIEKVLPDITEIEEGEGRFPLPSSSENLESLDQEDKEEIDIPKEISELKKENEIEKEQRREETKKPSAPEKKVKVRKSPGRTTFDPKSRFQDQSKRQTDRTKTIEDKVNGMQRRLVQINKTIYSITKEHGVVRKIQVQLNLFQKRLDKVDRSIANLHLKSLPRVKVGTKKPTALKKVKKKGSKKA